MTIDRCSCCNKCLVALSKYILMYICIYVHIYLHLYIYVYMYICIPFITLSFHELKFYKNLHCLVNFSSNLILHLDFFYCYFFYVAVAYVAMKWLLMERLIYNTKPIFFFKVATVFHLTVMKHWQKISFQT